MRLLLHFLYYLAMLSVGLSQGARADDSNTAYIVTYIETAPAAANKALGLLKQFSKASRKDTGNLRFEVLQRIGEGNHFLILESWSDKDAQVAHSGAAHTRELREKLVSLLRSPYDERAHAGLSIGPAGKGSKNAVYAVTHVDIVPTNKDAGIGLVKQLSEVSRKDKGNLRFDALTQSSRPNHMTVVETWVDRKALDAHGTAGHTRKFREKLLPLSGSLYDERLYKLVE